MKSKKINKIVEDLLNPADKFDDNDTEDIITFKDNVNKLLHDDDYVNLDITSFSLYKSNTFPADDLLSSATYKGKSVSRHSVFEGEDILSNATDDNATSDLDFDTEYDHTNKLKSSLQDENNEDIFSSSKSTKKHKLDIGESENDDDSEDSSNNESGEENEEDGDTEPSDESNIEDDLPESDEHKMGISILHPHSAKIQENDIMKGNVLRKQLSLWESLLEGRIKLQKCLSASNKLPHYSDFEKCKSNKANNGEYKIHELQESCFNLLDKFINIQRLLRKRSRDCANDEPEPQPVSIARHGDENEIDSADDSKCNAGKRRRLSTYPSTLDNLYNDYKPFRYKTLQKWNEKTKISTGKLAKSNFSAFDLPTVKQIEQIMSDKYRLIRRTQINRSHQAIIKNLEKNDQDINVNDNSEQAEDMYDPEIFDDNDFYHKLLRDYIEKKSTDISDPLELGKRLIELQKLRIKMKKKVDTRSTKGRKIRYNVHTKLVNFMAPVILDTWSDDAINDLCKSLFGRNLK